MIPNGESHLFGVPQYFEETWCSTRDSPLLPGAQGPHHCHKEPVGFFEAPCSTLGVKNLFSPVSHLGRSMKQNDMNVSVDDDDWGALVC